MEHHFKVEDAEKYGIKEAVLLYNITYWVGKNKANKKHFYDGSYWTYNSVSAFSELFPYMTKDQIRRALENLESQGAIKTGEYNENSYDRTKWFTTVNTELANLPNGVVENATPIPDNKPDIKKEKYIKEQDHPLNTPPLKSRGERGAAAVSDGVVRFNGVDYKMPFVDKTLVDLFVTLLGQKKWRNKGDTAITAALKKLGSVMLEDAIESVETAIAGEHQGLYPKKRFRAPDQQKPTQSINWDNVFKDEK